MKLFKFYYQYQKYGKKYFVETKLCKYPKRTKVYKTLLQNLNNDFIHCFGYENIQESKGFIKV